MLHTCLTAQCWDCDAKQMAHSRSVIESFYSHTECVDRTKHSVENGYLCKESMIEATFEATLVIQ